MEIKRNQAYILLGSNLGNRIQTFENALLLLRNELKVKVLSSIYKSPAWEMDDADFFLNQVIKIETSFSSTKLLQFLLDTENKLGRTRTSSEYYQSRTIDLDILYYNEDISQSSELILPHPRLHLRRFTLLPLQEIAPKMIHPVFQKSNEQLLKACTDNSEVTVL